MLNGTEPSPLLKQALSRSQNQFENSLSGFFKITSKYRLTPAATSNYGSVCFARIPKESTFQAPLTQRLVDRTEYAVNRRIINKVFR